MSDMNAVYPNDPMNARLLVALRLVFLMAMLPLAGCQWISQQDWLPDWAGQDKEIRQDPAALARQQSIDSLIAKGNLAFTKDRLSIPANDNALMYYREALRIDPDNEDAQNGLHKISKRFRKLSRIAHGNGDNKQAFKYLHQAESISGFNTPGNQKLRRELQETPAGQDQRALDQSLQEKFKAQKNLLEENQRANGTNK
jgi:hypothetical protein